MQPFQPLKQFTSGSFPQEYPQHFVAHTVGSYFGETKSVWDSISRWVPPQNENHAFWWKTTGPHLATLLSQSGYSVLQQYEALLFHYYLVVPRLGPRPVPFPSSTAPTPRWKSFMTDDFGPIEYSWKWDSGKELSDGTSSGPVIRYGIEAIGPYAGTPLDPLNQVSTKELLYQLDLAIGDIDLTWFHHLARTLYGPEDIASTTEGDKKVSTGRTGGLNSSSMFLAFELLKRELAVKSYFIPSKPVHVTVAGNEVLDRLTAAIRSLGMLCAEQEKTTQWPALDEMLSILDSNDDGKRFTIFMLAIDCVGPSKSRLKVYVRSPSTSFDSVVRILTMGRKRTVLEGTLQDLKDLWRMTLGLPTDFSTSEDLPQQEHATSGMCYHFDIQQGNAVPGIKIYIPVRHYGLSDMNIAYGLTGFLEARGRGKYAEAYIKALKELALPHQLERSCGVQTYISCAFDKEGLSITSYMNPNIYRGDRTS